MEKKKKKKNDMTPKPGKSIISADCDEQKHCDKNRSRWRRIFFLMTDEQ